MSLPELFQQMSELTGPVCAKDCPQPFSCCALEHCETAARYAKEAYGIDLERTAHPELPFMGPTGCTVAPHLRPKCTLHNCFMTGNGFWPFHSQWTNKYMALRLQIEKELQCKTNSAT